MSFQRLARKTILTLLAEAAEKGYTLDGPVDLTEVSQLLGVRARLVIDEAAQNGTPVPGAASISIQEPAPSPAPLPQAKSEKAAPPAPLTPSPSPPAAAAPIDPPKKSKRPRRREESSVRANILEACPAEAVYMIELAELAGYAYTEWFRNHIDALVEEGKLRRSKKGVWKP
jgi:hypothetical protein